VRSEARVRRGPYAHAVTRACLLLLVAFAVCAASPGEDAAERARRAAARGDAGAAASAWQEAARAWAREGEPRKSSDAFVRAAEASQRLGNHRDAAAQLRDALALAEASGPPGDVARVRGALGNLYIAIAEPGAAVRELRAALDLADPEGDAALQASILVNLGNAEARRDDAAAALAAYERAARRAASAQRPGLEVRAEANAARTRAQSGAPTAEVRARVEAAGERSREIASPAARLDVLLHLGHTLALLRGRGDPDAAMAAELRLATRGLLGEAEALAAAQGDDRAASQALGHMARLYEAEGRLGEAALLTERALRHADRTGSDALRLPWLVQAGRLRAASGEREGAIEAYEAAVELLETLRHAASTRRAPPASSPSSAREAPGAVYLAYVDLLLQRAAVRTGAAARADLRAAQATVERLKAAALRDYFEDECVDAALARRVGVAEASETAAVLYPILLPDRIELLLSRGAAIERSAVPVPAQSVRAEVAELRRLLALRGTRLYLRAAQRLHGWLIAPLAARLDALGIDTLVVVPDAALGTLPWAALHDGERFLVERLALAVTPGLDLTDPRPLARDGALALLGGVSEAVQGFEALPEVARELAAVRSLIDGDVLLDEEFSEPRVEAKLASRPFSVVHLASHAEFLPESADSFVLTHEGRVTMDELADYVGLFRYRQTPLELLVLSACSTAAGDERAALGLSGIAVKAGARSAVGTLWRVNDESSRRIVTRFYEELQQRGRSRAEALRRAQLAVLADPALAHPVHWAGFLLIGNWL